MAIFEDYEVKRAESIANALSGLEIEEAQNLIKKVDRYLLQVKCNKYLIYVPRTIDVVMNWDRERMEKKMQSNELRRLEIIGNENDAKELESLCKEKGLTKQDLAKILFTVRVRPGFQRSDFGI